jgi:hypothetical protein
MKKATRKKAATKKVAKAKRRKPAAGVTQAKGAKRVVVKAPQNKQQAAVANGMFLFTDDAWSLRYFDQNDLHFKEREVFG